ncbi:hypothetical protein TNCV_3107921 [Trichonephila clavipes]|uniref:Uncharacterized protein n=1 Tax=Trichonephila clavipes TaxID=2585209 RepID=A0A8X6VFM3_TRICX|nr:hypothetical protein TNCV_3107921 [Trichonephila clavipes]
MKPNKLKRHFETLHVAVHTPNDTVSRRIDDIAEDVEQQLFGKLRDKLFSIQLNEATDSNKDAHFIACRVIYSLYGLAIHQNDHQARRRFVKWAQNEIAAVPDFHKRILFSDEAHFWLNGYINKKNCRIWSEANPKVLWGYVKSLVYADKPQTLDHLEDNIRRVIADIRPQMLEKVIENWTSRLDYIRASCGSPMPEIIFKM